MTMATPAGWPCEAIWEAVAPRLPGFTVEVVPELDSTNTELMRRARQGITDPVLLLAEQQTAGRGRLGRRWLSAPQGPGHDGHALTFSLGMCLDPADWSGLSLAIGLKLAQCLHPEITLKWPNDLWWQQRKLAGILIETSAAGAGRTGRFVVVGVGINLTTPCAEGLTTRPVGLRELRADALATITLLDVVPALTQTLLDFEAHGFAPCQAAFNARDALHHLPVTLSDGLHGVAEGVDATGALRVRTTSGLQRVTSAEVSVRVCG